jgi:hypothetical protein
MYCCPPTLSCPSPPLFMAGKAYARRGIGCIGFSLTSLIALTAGDGAAARLG